MNRRHQIILDFFRLLNDGRLSATNVGYMTKVDAPCVYFDVLFCGRLVDSVRLDHDYSNILAMARRILSAHATRNDAPLMRLRVNTLSHPRRVTLGVTSASNLEFFDMRNEKVSDQLADALLNDIHADNVHLYSSDYSALMTSYNYHATFIFTLIK